MYYFLCLFPLRSSLISGTEVKKCGETCRCVVWGYFGYERRVAHTTRSFLCSMNACKTCVYQLQLARHQALCHQFRATRQRSLSPRPLSQEQRNPFTDNYCLYSTMYPYIHALILCPINHPRTTFVPPRCLYTGKSANPSVAYAENIIAQSPSLPLRLPQRTEKTVNSPQPIASTYRVHETSVLRRARYAM